MIPAPLSLLATELSHLGRPSIFLEPDDEKVAAVLCQLRSDPTRVAELLFLDDVLEALGGEHDASVALQIQIRIDLHPRPAAQADLVKLCQRINRSLGHFGLYPHSEFCPLLVRSLIPWTDRYLPVALVASILDAMDDGLEIIEPLLFAVAQERKTFAEADSELTQIGRADSPMHLAPWQYPHTP